MRKRLFALAAALLSGVAALPAAAGNHGTAPDKNIVQVAKQAGSFQTLLTAIKRANLVGTLSGQGSGPLTVFAPTDEAFAKLPAGALETLLADKEALKNVLLYHVAPGKLMASDVVARTSIEMANGGTVTVDASSGVMVNSSKVVATDVMARNGVIHVIDTVLLP